MAMETKAVDELVDQGEILAVMDAFEKDCDPGFNDLVDLLVAAKMRPMDEADKMGFAGASDLAKIGELEDPTGKMYPLVVVSDHDQVEVYREAELLGMFLLVKS